MSILEKILRWLFMLLVSISSTSLMLSIYFIKSSYWLLPVEENWTIFINIIIYICLPFVLSYLILSIFRHCFSVDSITNPVAEIKSIDNEYIPIYLGYIFVSVSIPNLSTGVIDMSTLIIVYGIVNLVIVFSSTVCFNPIFIIFGYTYYAVKTQGNVTVFIISKNKRGKNDREVTFPRLRKITETVFIES